MGGAAGPLKIRKNGFIRVITSNWYWDPNACWNWRNSGKPQGPSATPASRCSAWAWRCCTGYPFFKLSHWRSSSTPWSLWQCARMVTMARAQHKASLFLMVTIHRFFLFSRSRHRRPGLCFFLRWPDPRPGMDTNTTSTWKPRSGLKASLLFNLLAKVANISSKRAVRFKNSPTVKFAVW